MAEISPGGRPIDTSSLNRSTKVNWVEKRGGLPPYVRGIARGVAKRRHGGKVTDRDIAVAISSVHKWRKSKNAAVRAASIKAVAHWEASKRG